jgi:hypothetical protein
MLTTIPLWNLWFNSRSPSNPRPKVVYIGLLDIQTCLGKKNDNSNFPRLKGLYLEVGRIDRRLDLVATACMCQFQDMRSY